MSIVSIWEKKYGEYTSLCQHDWPDAFWYVFKVPLGNYWAPLNAVVYDVLVYSMEFD